MAELLSVLKRKKTDDEMLWNHTSQVLCLTANINSKKTYKAEDFNPYHLSKKRSEMPKTKEDIQKIIEQHKNINGKASDH